MKAKLFLLLAMTITLANKSHGQTSSDIYIIGTSMDTRYNDNQTGLLKHVMPKGEKDATESIAFRINSREKGYSIPIVHYNRVYSPRKIVTMEVAKLSTLNTIDVDRFILQNSKEQAIQWGKAHVNKTIWVIDRNDFYWSNGKQYMKLIETTITAETFPEPPKITYEYVD